MLEIVRDKHQLLFPLLAPTKVLTTHSNLLRSNYIMDENEQNRKVLNTDELAIKTESLSDLIYLMDMITSSVPEAQGIGTIMPSEEKISTINNALNTYNQILNLLPAMASLVSDIHDITFELPDEVFLKNLL